MSPFNTASFPDSLAIAKEASMVIGSIDEVLFSFDLPV